MTEALFKQVKRKLNITWDDEETTARINDIMNSAHPDLIHRLGITDETFDFGVAGVENTLFLAYCLYEWNHSLNEFWINYANDIATVRHKNEVAYYLANKETESEQG